MTDNKTSEPLAAATATAPSLPTEELKPAHYNFDVKSCFTEEGVPEPQIAPPKIPAEWLSESRTQLVGPTLAPQACLTIDPAASATSSSALLIQTSEELAAKKKPVVGLVRNKVWCYTTVEKWLRAHPMQNLTAPPASQLLPASAETNDKKKEKDKVDDNDDDEVDKDNDDGRAIQNRHGEYLFRSYYSGEYFWSPWPNGSIPSRISELAKWRMNAKPPKMPTAEEAAVLAPSADVLDTAAWWKQRHPENQVQATWMGHASFLVQSRDVSVLTDPVWDQRASPVQFAGPKRFVQPVAKLEALGDIPIVTISHNHYDHESFATVKQLEELYQPVFVVPWGIKRRWKSSYGCFSDEALLKRVVELDWFQTASITVDFADRARRRSDKVVKTPTLRTTGKQTMHITAVPAQHWSLRSGFDRNKDLYCGFVYETQAEAETSSGEAEKKDTDQTKDQDQDKNESAKNALVHRFFHSGDTGYAKRVFQQIGRTFGHFDLALLPIGAYHPRFFLHTQHVDPAQAVLMHKDLNLPTLSLGMHWGTFILTDEDIDEPRKLLPAEMKLLLPDVPVDSFLAPKHGETYFIDVCKAES